MRMRPLTLLKKQSFSAGRSGRVASIVAKLPTALVLACGLLLPRAASAFTIQSPATRGCHEEITIDAWRQVHADLPKLTPPIASRGDDDALIADTPFDVPEDLQEIGLVTLLLGIRENDIADLAVTSLSDLAPVNSDPKAQRQHCLRTPAENEPNGTAKALAECQDFIRDQLRAAVDSLADDGSPDGTKREELEVSLAIRGKVKVKVPSFQLHAARGLHAIQDSFTHTYRNPDNPLEIRVILNFSEYAENTLDEAVDGPPHSSELDRCDDPDALRTERHALAIEASAAALRALLEPSTREAKFQAIDDVITMYTSLDTSAECTADNDWCDAPEHAYGTSSCGCVAAGATPRRSGGAALFVAGLAALVAAARCRRKSQALRKRLAPRALSVLLFGGLSIHAVDAKAQSSAEPKGVSAPVDALAGDSSAAVPGHKDPAGSFFARIAAGAAYDKPGFSGGLGLRYQISEPFMIGFDAEWNPWLAVTPGKLRAGAANGYFSLIRRFQLRYEAVNIRTTLSAGASYLLFDLVGAPSGSFGPYFGLSLLGVEWKVARGFYLTIDPTNISFPIPHITGVPFGYLQYRLLVGLEFGG
jgi:hypothetical protein